MDTDPFKRKKNSTIDMMDAFGLLFLLMHVCRQVLADIEIFSMGSVYLKAISRFSRPKQRGRAGARAVALESTI